MTDSLSEGSGNITTEKRSEVDTPEFQNCVPNVVFEISEDLNPIYTHKVSASAICSIRCSRNCEGEIVSWPDDFKKKIHQQFREDHETLIEKKNHLLQHLRSQMNQGMPTEGFRLHGHPFCIGAMVHLTGMFLPYSRLLF